MSVTLNLSQESMYMLACYELGRYFNDDTEDHQKWDNISNIGILKSQMTKETLAAFAEMENTIDAVKDTIKKGGEKLVKKYNADVYKLYKKALKKSKK